MVLPIIAEYFYFCIRLGWRTAKVFENETGQSSRGEVTEVSEVRVYRIHQQTCKQLFGACTSLYKVRKAVILKARKPGQNFGKFEYFF